MSRFNFAIIPVIFILILAVFAFLSPKLFSQKAATSANEINELVMKRFTSIGNSIAHATFVVDAIAMADNAPLSEIIASLRQDEPEILAVHFTDAKNIVLASSDPNLVDKTIESDLLKSGTSVVQNNGGVFDGGFSIAIGSKPIGALYFQAKPLVPEIKIASSPNPILLAVGALFAILTFLITMGMGKNMETKMVEQINQRQEEVFKPKIESLKKEQQEAQSSLNQINKKLQEAQQTLDQANQEYATRKKEIESNPVVQSIEKLKASEADLLKRLTAMKEEETKITREHTLLVQKRDEIMSALEAEKKEEAALREKLDLIKKKILHLETSSK